MARPPSLATLASITTTAQGFIVDPPTTMTPAWTVYAWPPVLWQASSAPELHFVHLGTQVVSYGDRANGGSGQTLWGESTGERSAGVAWDWVQLERGVVAMADPLSLVTNLKLLDSQGEVLTPREVAVHLNEIVHALPWQTEVRRALEGPRADPQSGRGGQ